MVQPASSQDPIRIAMVGTGNIARIHAAALAAVDEPGATIVAATDVDRDRLKAFCQEHRIQAAYNHLDDLLAETIPDLVHICTPPSVHHEQALACLQAGCNVLVEKPPTISLREFDQLTAAQGTQASQATRGTQATRGPWLACVFQHRFGPGQRRLKELADTRKLGRPLLAVCHTTWFRDQAYFDVDWRGRWDTEGGGPTMGHGIHQMDMLLDVLGEWTEVCAIARRQARRVHTEDLSLAHVTFKNGAVASIINSVLSPREESYLRYDFERATVELTHLYGYRDDDWRITPRQGHDLPKWPQTGNHRSGHAAQFQEILSALRAENSPPVAPEHARNTLCLVAAIYASAFGRRPVTPDDLAPGTPFYTHMNGGTHGW